MSHRARRILALLTLLALLGGCGKAFRQEAALLVQQGDYVAAEPLLRKAINAHSLDHNAYLLLGRVYRHTGREEQARLVFLQIARNKPDALVEPGLEPGFENRPVAELAEHYLRQEPSPAASSQPAPAPGVDSLEREILDRHGVSGSGLSASADESGTPDSGVVGDSSEKGLETIQHLAGRTPSQNSFGVHVLSFSRALNLESGRQSMLAKFPRLLGDKQFRSQRVEMPGKGVYHRLYVGPWGTRSQAAQVCDRLKRAWGYCQVVPF
jgi:tetratricopeptide (TPR) repeat protein